MLTDIVYIVIGLVALFVGGEWLVRGASRLAAALGVAPLVIGVTIVSMGTSTPELIVSTSAALQGQSEIAIGNIVGSNIANIGLILAIGAFIMLIPIQLKLLQREIPICLGVSVVALLMALNGDIDRIDGLLLILAFIGFNIFVIYMARHERLRPGESEALAEFERTEPPVNRLAELLRIAAGIVLLVIGAQFLVDGAVNIARGLNVSELAIGLTLVAVGTSLPELVTTVVAAMKKNEDILVGNIVGSNIFNLLGILGITAVLQPVPVSPNLVAVEIPVMIAFAGALVLFGLRKKIEKLPAVLMLGAYLVYVVLLFAGQQGVV